MFAQNPLSVRHWGDCDECSRNCFCTYGDSSLRERQKPVRSCSTYINYICFIATISLAIWGFMVKEGSSEKVMFDLLLKNEWELSRWIGLLSLCFCKLMNFKNNPLRANKGNE